jgi:threonine dehydratase
VEVTKLFHQSEGSSGCRLYLKLESEQITGSFKLRGAANKILVEQIKGTKSFLTASTGNHALAVSHIAGALGVSCQYVVPTSVDAMKLDVLKRHVGAENVVLHGNDCVDAEMYAKRLAETSGACYISPYNDDDIINGQGTSGLELLEQCPDVNVVYVTAGGGGLIGGVGKALHGRSIEVVGCSPSNSHVLEASVKVPPPPPL